MVNKFIATIFITDHNFGQAVPLFVIHTQIDNMRDLLRVDMDSWEMNQIIQIECGTFCCQRVGIAQLKNANI